MQTLEQASSTSADTLWHRINMAVKRGQTHPEGMELRGRIAAVLGESPDAVPAIHPGVVRVIGRLRQGDAATMRRLLACGDIRLPHTALAALFIERGWKRYEQDVHSDAVPTQAAVGESMAASMQPEALADAPFLLCALERANRITEQRTIGTHNPLSQYETGTSAAFQSVAELARVLVPAYWQSDERTGDDRAALTEAGERSIPAMLHAYGSIPLDSHKALVQASAVQPEGPIGRNQKQSDTQDPARYRLLRDESGKLWMTPGERVLALIQDAYASPGCPAKYAKSRTGQSVIASLAGRLLRHWKNDILPSLFPDGSRTLSVNNIADYNAGLATLHR